jgi:hypothetical protein
MPPAKKPTASSSRSRAAFKEPVALKRLDKSLESAQQALTELGKHTGRDVSQGARDLYKDLRSFVSSARRDSGKLAKALQRDFERAQKQLADATAAGDAPRPRAAARSRQPAPGTRAKRSTRKTG